MIESQWWIAGLTGMALAWEDDLEALTAPRLVLAPPSVAGAPMRDPMGLRDAALARHPGIIADFLLLTIARGKDRHRLAMLRFVWGDGQSMDADNEIH